jgi:uncharacterized protein
MNPNNRLTSNFVDPDDRANNNSANTEFDAILNARFSRRFFLRGAATTGAGALLSSVGLVGCSSSDSNSPSDAPIVKAPLNIDFAAVGKGLADTIVVPTGYSASTLYRCGDPLVASLASYKNDGTDTDMDRRAGDCHDGIHYFGLNAGGTRDPAGSTRGLLAMNHEYMTPLWLHANGPTTANNVRPAAEVDKETAVHGVSVVEVRLNNGKWEYVQASAFNRRITTLTPMEMSGPLRGIAPMRTKYSPTGTATRGTQNNCGTGISPWGTFLTAEENWAGYFARANGDNTQRSARELVSLARYGLSQNTVGRYGWATAGTDDAYARWNASVTGTSTDGSDDYRNVMNTFGFIVEIDPYNASAVPKKRTALGRFAHEAAVLNKPAVGKPLAVYMGDDSRNEYIYKFVSRAVWAASDGTSDARMSIGDKFFDDGTLYVAKFNADGTGTWLPLTFDNPAIRAFTTYVFTDQADVLLNTRLAADALGATKMDRPEWGALNPTTGDIYMTLTNNSNRTAATADSSNPRAYSDLRNTVVNNAPATTTQNGNVNGHIIRFAENGGEPNATQFRWDVYLFGAQADADAARVNLSGLTADNDFSSPDGLWFSDASSFAWIQTDDGAYTDVTNCMLLVGKAGRVGDGAKVTLTYDNAGTAKTVDTFVGKKPAANELKRFMVGPIECEITGITETPDGKAIFVNIQHPGEDTPTANLGTPASWTSYWPDGNKTTNTSPRRPRSSTVVVTKNDGGIVGT